MIRGVLLFPLRALCAVACMLVIMGTALPLAALGRGKE